MILFQIAILLEYEIQTAKVSLFFLQFETKQCFQVLGYNASCFLFTGEDFWGQDPYGDPWEFIGFKGSIQYCAYSCCGWGR